MPGIRSKDFRTAGTLFAFFALSAFPAWGQSASYKVRLDFNHPLHATVEAQLEVTDGTIFTARHAGGYAWWEFIRHLRRVRDDGSSVPLQPEGDGRWILPTATAGPVRLNYEVDLSFTEQVRAAIFAAAYFLATP